jgi:hypothetical protein
LQLGVSLANLLGLSGCAKDTPKIHQRFTTKTSSCNWKIHQRYAKDSPAQLGVSFSCNLANLLRAQKIRQRYAKLQLKDTPRYAKDTPLFCIFFSANFFFGPLEKKVEINKLINLFILLKIKPKILKFIKIN